MGTSVPSLRQSKRVMQPSRPAPPIATTDVDGPGRMGGSVAAASLERRVGAAGRGATGGVLGLDEERATVMSKSPRGERSRDPGVKPQHAREFAGSASRAPPQF